LTGEVKGDELDNFDLKFFHHFPIAASGVSPNLYVRLVGFDVMTKIILPTSGHKGGKKNSNDGDSSF
jgi:hypothetical protein